MANVTGTLTDFGGASLAPYQPRLHFIPSGPAVNAGKFLATKPIIVTPAADGSFTASLEPTVGLHPSVWYRLHVKWLDTANQYIGMDFLDRMDVPELGGPIGDLIGGSAPLAAVWVGTSPPINTKRGQLWLEIPSGDLYEWS